MNIIGALALLLFLVFLAASIFLQTLLFLAFANDASTPANRNSFTVRLLLPVAAALLLLGVVTPPILFYCEARWTSIWLTALIGLGGAWLIVLSAVISQASKS